MCNRGKDLLSRLIRAFIRSKAGVQSLHLMHAPATFCTLSKPTCAIRPAYAPRPPPPSPHLRVKRESSFTSFSHPLSTCTAPYPRKTSLYARFRDIWRLVGAGMHIYTFCPSRAALPCLTLCQAILFGSLPDLELPCKAP